MDEQTKWLCEVSDELLRRSAEMSKKQTEQSKGVQRLLKKSADLSREAANILEKHSNSNQDTSKETIT